VAVDATAYNHPERATRLRNLGINLGRRYETTGLIKDLNQTIDATSNALDVFYHDRLDHADCLS
jgi:hypothetical protein